MAKLSARGRVELARVSKEWEFCYTHYMDKVYDWGNSPVYCKRPKDHEGSCDGDSLISWERSTKALMSDGTILKKIDCLFPSNATHGSNGKHSYGWKVLGKVKKTLTTEQWVNLHLDKGYKRS